MSLVAQMAPDFTANAVTPENLIEPFTLSSLRGKYVVLFFYPMDFTFVCPTELVAFDNAIEKFKALVETQGTVAAIDDWGKRRLAYPINDLNEGHYVLMTFTSAPELPAELDRVLKITEGVIRSMIICKDE